MNKILELYNKYKMPILYIFFGGLTTLVNMLAYFLCYDMSHISNVISTIIAWVLSVLFAYITNKFYVFESKTVKKKALLFEVFSFFGCRGITGLLDLGIMWLTVDILHYNGLLMKLISNVIVIILNYVVSKVFIFRKK